MYLLIEWGHFGSTSPRVVNSRGSSFKTTIVPESTWSGVDSTNFHIVNSETDKVCKLKKKMGIRISYGLAGYWEKISLCALDTLNKVQSYYYKCIALRIFWWEEKSENTKLFMAWANP